MTIDLRPRLSTLLPRVIAWVETQSAEIARTGRALDTAQVTLARSVGVREPELVRLAEVATMPRPADPVLQQAATMVGLLAPDTVGLTLGHSIVVCEGHLSTRLLSHELRHVHQYENAGSLADFLAVYLRQILDHGYLHAPLEVDARAHEHDE